MSSESLHDPSDEVASELDLATLSAPTKAAGDSMTVAVWTVVSRATGVAKFAAIGAVLGPTFFGNTFQFTNSLPNLLYYGFLGGSLFSSLLIPSLVNHIDSGDRRSTERVAGGFLGVTMVALACVTPLAIVFGPLLLRLASLGGAAQVVGADQQRVGMYLIVMFIPQVFLYSVVGSATAVMNAHRRFALAAAAPALENIGMIVVLCIAAVVYGTGATLGSVSTGELLLLGLGTTGAVALHASVQWWGARRTGATLIPRWGWHDPEVRAVVYRGLPSLAQASLLALQMLALLSVANRIPGGVVAFQMALNFYYLAIALGATPVALSLAPRLARMRERGEEKLFTDTLLRGFALAFFVTIPAAVAYLTLARPLARAVSFGQMSSAVGVSLVAISLRALALAVIGQTAFDLCTYASYARKDTRSPLRSMTLQAAVCLLLLTATLVVHGTDVVLVLGLGFSAAICVAAVHLGGRLFKRLEPGAERIWPSVVKVVVGAAAMVVPAWLTARLLERMTAGQAGSVAAMLLAALVGVAIFLAVQALLKTPELGWITGGLSDVRPRSRREPRHG